MTSLITIVRNSYPKPYIVQTLDIRYTSGGGAAGANVLCVTYLGKYPSAFPVSNAYIYVTTRNGNIDVAVGTFVGNTFTRLASTGSTALGAANAGQTIAMPYTFVPGIDYWAAVEFDGTGGIQRSFGVAVANNVVPHSRAKIGATYPIASSEASVTTTSATSFWVGFA